VTGFYKVGYYPGRNIFIRKKSQLNNFLKGYKLLFFYQESSVIKAGLNVLYGKIWVIISYNIFWRQSLLQ